MLVWNIESLLYKHISNFFSCYLSCRNYIEEIFYAYQKSSDASILDALQHIREAEGQTLDEFEELSIILEEYTESLAIDHGFVS